MIQLGSCKRCGGFLALALRACPHCEAPLPILSRAVAGLATLAGGGAVSMTLMACYGPACVDDACTGDYPDDPPTDTTATAADIEDLQVRIAAGSYAGTTPPDDTPCTVVVEGDTVPRRIAFRMNLEDGSNQTVNLGEGDEIRVLRKDSTVVTLDVPARGVQLELRTEGTAPTLTLTPNNGASLTCAELKR